MLHFRIDSLNQSERSNCLIQPVFGILAKHSYIVKLARLGGYLARTHDPPPGNTVIWRGLSRLTDIELGIMIGVQLVGN